MIAMLIHRIIHKITREYKHLVFTINSHYISLFHKQCILKDIEGQSYKTIMIKGQKWMAENLGVSKFVNGDPIPFTDNDDGWQLAGRNGIPAWSYYKDDPDSVEKTGKLYNWYAVNDPRGLAPDGWQIPTDEDWRKMISLLGGEEKAGRKMKSRWGWKNEGNGSNKSGFNALPGGYRDPAGWFGNGGYGRWWSSTQESNEKAWRYRLCFDNSIINRFNGPKGYGFSIRCIKKS